MLFYSFLVTGILIGFSNNKLLCHANPVNQSFEDEISLLETDDSILARKDFYPNNSPRPKIYTGKRNSDLLCRKNMAEICMPCDKLNKVESEELRKTTANIVYK